MKEYTSHKYFNLNIKFLVKLGLVNLLELIYNESELDLIWD